MELKRPRAFVLAAFVLFDGVVLIDFGVEVALFGFEVASHSHDVFDDAFEL